MRLLNSIGWSLATLYIKLHFLFRRERILRPLYRPGG